VKLNKRRAGIELPPKIHESCFIADDSTIIGNVSIAKECSVWPKAVLRGDQNSINIQKGSNVQDGVVIHVDEGHKTNIGKDVTLGHNAVIHGCEIGDETIIGMNATVLSGAKVGKNCIIGANALVPQDKEIPDYSIAVGVPVDILKEGDESLKEKTRSNAEHYHQLRDDHKEGKYERYKK